MRNRLFLCFGLLGALAAARAADNPLADVRTTLEKWVETRQMISKTRAAWQADKETLEQTIQLMQRELAAVEEQAGKLSTNNAAAQKEWAEAEALKQTSTEALDRAKEFAAGFEAQLKALAQRLPVPLQEDKNFKGFMNRLPADPATTKASAPERAQALVGLLNELDKFNTAVAVFSEKRKNPQGEEVAVETIYVGLGAAYFVNDAGDFAGSGTPGANGWEWATQPELAPAVREVLHIYRNERAARFVPLPAVIR